MVLVCGNKVIGVGCNWMYYLKIFHLYIYVVRMEYMELYKGNFDLRFMAVGLFVCLFG